MNNSEIKLKLLQNCQEWANKRLKSAQNVQNRIQESLLNETKSSAGDKHETGRAMLQIERENIGKQLNEIQKIIEIIDRTNPSISSEKVKLGSLIITDAFNYFICVSAGALELNGQLYYAISAHSPIGRLFLGKKEYDEVAFQNKTIRIKELH